MKQFNNLYDACHYHTHCYVCQAQLKINQDYTFEFDHVGGSRTWMVINMSLGVDSDVDDLIKIDIHSGQIEYEYKRRKTNYDNEIIRGNFDFRDQTPIRNPYAANLPPSTNHPKYAGTIYHGIGISCSKCYQFSYVVRLEINTAINAVISICLNSESISVEEGDTVHEIKNIYTTKNTEYLCLLGKTGSLAIDGQMTWKDDKKITIPLIPLNLKKPMETISRVKKLILFS